jgi:hypothetical protein
MIRYTVVWALDVQNDFIQSWLAGDSDRRRQLTTIADLLDKSLVIAPETRGVAVPSEPSLRIWSMEAADASIAVTFEVFPQDRLVRILRISAVFD